MCDSLCLLRQGYTRQSIFQEVFVLIKKFKDDRVSAHCFNVSMKDRLPVSTCL